jgi:hypothetical protein
LELSAQIRKSQHEATPTPPPSTASTNFPSRPSP